MCYAVPDDEVSNFKPLIIVVKVLGIAKKIKTQMIPILKMIAPSGYYSIH